MKLCTSPARREWRDGARVRTLTPPTLKKTMLRVALVEPEIPQNTGNIARLCAATNTPLHIVGMTGFRLDDRAVRRAGLYYWPEVSLQRHRDLDVLRSDLPEARFVYFTTKAEQPYFEWKF